MKATALGSCVFFAFVACVTPPKPKPVDDPQPKPVVIDTPSADPQVELRRAVEGFVAASEARQFDAIHALLSKPLRDRYTPALLARDFEAEPYARERVARIKAKATQPLTVQGERASLEWAPGRSLQFVREAAAWKIASME